MAKDDRPADDAPPKARGKAPTLSDAALGRMAEVTPDDVADAAGWWAKVAPAEWRGLIDAKADDRRT